MTYFVIIEDDIPKAVITHDYSSSVLTFRSVSDYLTAAIDCSIRTTKGNVLCKTSKNSVNIVEFSESNPSFLEAIVGKVVFSGFWKIKETGEFVDIAEFENFSASIL